MSDFTIVAATRQHGEAVAAALSAAQQAAHARLGEEAADALRFLLDNSAYRRAALVRGHPVAIWGVTDNDGGVWVQSTAGATAHPFAFVREARREVREMLRFRARIVMPLGQFNTRAQRFARLLGFVSAGCGTAAGQPFVRMALAREAA
jgi:hypothetical protein